MMQLWPISKYYCDIKIDVFMKTTEISTRLTNNLKFKMDTT